MRSVRRSEECTITGSKTCDLLRYIMDRHERTEQRGLQYSTTSTGETQKGVRNSERSRSMRAAPNAETGRQVRCHVPDPHRSGREED